jgi:AcrR family transcriptional regulator
MGITEEGARRKSELLDLALNLFSGKGYMDTSIQDIITVAGVSKGSFYHYFKSKEEVLDEIIDRYLQKIVRLSGRIADDPSLSAIEKYKLLFTEIQKIRTANRDRFKFLLKMMLNERNCLFINRYTEKSVRMALGPYRSILEQGKKEGIFNIRNPEAAAELIIRFGILYRTKIARLYVHALSDPDLNKEITEMIEFMQETVEKILGVKSGMLGFLSESFKNQFKR